MNEECPWKLAVIDECVVNWILWDEDNPRTTIRKLVVGAVLMERALCEANKNLWQEMSGI